MKCRTSDIFVRLTLIVTLLALAIVLPTAAQAGVKFFRPDNFKPVYLNDGLHGTVQFGYYLSAANSNGQYYRSKLKLPVGSRITGITMYYKGINSLDDGYFEIRRIRTPYADDWVATASVDNENDNTGQVVEIRADIEDVPKMVIKKKYRYYINVRLFTLNSRFYSAKVFYEEP
jgi:hypothetical protein